MIKNIWSVLCGQSVIDGESNNISLLNVIEKMQGTVEIRGQKPEILTVPLKTELVTLWQRTSLGKFTFNCKTEVISPEGKHLASIIQDIEFPEDKQRMRNRVRMDSIPVTGPGLYIFKTTTSIAGKKSLKIVTETPLEVGIEIKLVEK